MVSDVIYHNLQSVLTTAEATEVRVLGGVVASPLHSHQPSGKIFGNIETIIAEAKTNLAVFSRKAPPPHHHRGRVCAHTAPPCKQVRTEEPIGETFLKMAQNFEVPLSSPLPPSPLSL